MNTDQLGYFLLLWQIPGMGPAAQKLIVQQYPRLSDFFNLSNQELRQLGCTDDVIRHVRQPNWQGTDAILEWSRQPNRHLLTCWDEKFPSQLREIQSAPALLFAHGLLATLDFSQLAIVGSRNPTRPGKYIAEKYAARLAERGLGIISGMALGIDAMAHQGALSAGGKTIAVLGTGVDIVYPRAHQALALSIIEQGLLISEFPLGMTAHKDNFPRRNRIISGLALGTFVVEAAIKSGSLITARYAMEQGREVFAMPSSINNPMAKGCHWLIKQGATLIESVDDIWQEIQQHDLKLAINQEVMAISLDFPRKQPYIEQVLSETQRQLLDQIGFDTMGIESLSGLTSLNIGQLSVVLLELELLGLITAVPGGYQRANLTETGL